MKPIKISKDFIVPNLLVLPLVAHWLLPSGMEYRLYISLFGVLFFLPNIFYLFYIFNYKKLKIPFKRNQVRRYIVILVLLWIYTLIHTLSNRYGITSFVNVLFGNMPFIYLPLLFFLFPLDLVHLDKTKYLLAFSLIFISLQVILYGLGIMTYTSATGEDLTANEYDIGGVFRVSTTVGASTGSGLMIAMISILIAGFYSFKPLYKIALLSLATVALFFTLSRGPIILWLLFAIVFVLRLLKKLSFGYKMLFAILIVSGVFAMDKYGVFDPLKERLELKSSDIDDDVTSGRSAFNKDAISILKGSDYFGVGLGRVFPEKHLKNMLEGEYSIRAHDTYLVYLCELGVIGGGLYILLFLFVLLRTDFKKTTIGWGLLFVLILNFNLEAVFISSEYLGVVLLMILASQKWNLSLNQTVK